MDFNFSGALTSDLQDQINKTLGGSDATNTLPVTETTQYTQDIVQEEPKAEFVLTEEKETKTTVEEKYVPKYTLPLKEKYNIKELGNVTLQYGGYANATKDDDNGISYLDGLVPYYNVVIKKSGVNVILTGNPIFSKTRAKHVLGFDAKGKMKTIYFFNDETNCPSWEKTAMINMFSAIDSDVTVINPNKEGFSGDTFAGFNYSVYGKDMPVKRYYSRLKTYNGDNPMGTNLERLDITPLLLSDCLTHKPTTDAERYSIEIFKEFYMWFLIKCTTSIPQSVVSNPNYQGNIRDIILLSACKDKDAMLAANQAIENLINKPNSIETKAMISQMLTVLDSNLLLPELYVKE